MALLGHRPHSSLNRPSRHSADIGGKAEMSQSQTMDPSTIDGMAQNNIALQLTGP